MSLHTQIRQRRFWPAMGSYDVRRIADPVHNSIGLSEVELKIISTPAFQRLRGVKQLGLAYLVYPGADYSRFSHSLGVCHVTWQILTALKRNCPDLDITDDEIQIYRLAGLLHDVGHYPFSHTMEHAVKEFYANSMMAPLESGKTQDEGTSQGINHEQVGKKIVHEDRDIKAILDAAKIDPSKISAIFLRESPPKFANLVSSDLDADRIDYLLRTAHHTGLPYGSVDLTYLLSQLRVDKEDRICLTRKAVRTAEHFLLSRYFDYSQVAHHKTVAALELVLAKVLAALLDKKYVDFSKNKVEQMIANGDWSDLDDAAMDEHIATLSKDRSDENIATMAKSILLRSPPKLIWEHNKFYDRQSATEVRHIKSRLKSKIPEWSKKYKISEVLWWMWDTGLTFTKIGANVSVASLVQPDEKGADRYEQAIRILRDDNSSDDIMSIEHSLMSVLSDKARYAVRLYVLLDENTMAVRDQLAAEVRAEMDRE